jgi:hypothetical protein
LDVLVRFAWASRRKSCRPCHLKASAVAGLGRSAEQGNGRSSRPGKHQPLAVSNEAAELRERSVWLYFDSEPRPAIRRLAEHLGVHHAALRTWIRRDQADRESSIESRGREQRQAVRDAESAVLGDAEAGLSSTRWGVMNRRAAGGGNSSEPCFAGIVRRPREDQATATIGPTM